MRNFLMQIQTNPKENKDPQEMMTGEMRATKRKKGQISKENGPGWTEPGTSVCCGQASSLPASD